jgi:hypothetical protein
LKKNKNLLIRKQNHIKQKKQNFVKIIFQIFHLPNFPASPIAPYNTFVKIVISAATAKMHFKTKHSTHMKFFSHYYVLTNEPNLLQHKFPRQVHSHFVSIIYRKRVGEEGAFFLNAKPQKLKKTVISVRKTLYLYENCPLFPYIECNCIFLRKIKSKFSGSEGVS